MTYNTQLLTWKVVIVIMAALDFDHRGGFAFDLVTLETWEMKHPVCLQRLFSQFSLLLHCQKK